MGFIVVGNHEATVITSSHGFNCLSQSSFDVSVVSANKLAELQEFVVITNWAHKNSANFFSNKSSHLHSVRLQSNTDSIIYSNSFSSKTFPDTGTNDVHGIKLFFFDSISFFSNDCISSLNIKQKL
jgi:hypothetical protein